MGSVVGSVLGTVGGLISGGKAADAAKGSAESLRNAANLSYGRAQFNPIGIKTNLGQSNFTMGPDGQLTSAGYSLSPELQAIQNRVIGGAGQYDPTQVGQAAQPLYGGAQSLFNLGQQYLATSPEQAAQDYMTQQRNLLAPGYEQALSGVRNQQFQTGRTGLAVGGTSAGYNGVGSPGLLATNPEMQALYNAKAKQDADIAAKADLYGQQRAQFGAGLFGSGGTLLGQVPALTSAGYSPLTTQLGLANTIESYGQQPFTLGQNLATSQSNANVNAGQLYMQPQAAAANAYAQYQGYSPIGTALSGAGQAIGGMGGGGFGSVGGWFDNMMGNPSTASRYGTNAGSQQTSMLAAQDMGFF